MTLDIKIIDGEGKGTDAIVSETGELITRPFEYSDTNSATLNVADQAFNLFEPQANSNFIITAIVLSTNKDIGINGSLVTIYEASEADSTIVDKERLAISMLRNVTLPITPLLTKINFGKYLNVKHDDASQNAEVFVTVMGYFLPNVGSNPT